MMEYKGYIGKVEIDDEVGIVTSQSLYSSEASG